MFYRAFLSLGYFTLHLCFFFSHVAHQNPGNDAPQLSESYNDSPQTLVDSTGLPVVKVRVMLTKYSLVTLSDL